MADAARDRIVWLDQVRAVGILLVVAGHAMRSVERSGLDGGAVYAAADFAIYSFHMPLFFILAGMSHGLAGERRPPQKLRGLWWTVVWPYVLWSAVWIVLKTTFSAAANEPTTAVFGDILTRPVDHFWFLYVLFVLRAGWYAVEAIGSPALRHAAAVGPLIVAFLGGPPAEGVITPWLFFWAAFYGIGLLIAPALVAPPVRARLWLLAAAAGAIWLAILATHPDLYVTGFGIARTLVGLAGSAAVIAAVAALSVGGRAGRILGLVGEASLTIFLTHTIVGAAVRVALARLDLLTPETLAVGATVAGMVLPVVLHVAVLGIGARLDLPLGRWLGFGGARRSHYLTQAPSGPRTARA